MLLTEDPDFIAATSYARTSEVTLPAGLGWGASPYPITGVGYRNVAGVRKGYVSGYSPWAAAEYQSTRNGPQIYMSLTGSDSTGAGTSGSPYATPSKAITVANAGGQPATVWVPGNLYQRNANGGWLGAVMPTVPICFMAYGGIVQMGSIDNYTWTVNGTYSNVHQTARSNAASVYDPSQRDRFGNAVMYRQVTSLARCAAIPGSWYTDNVTVYVNPFDDTAVTNYNASIYIKGDTWDFAFGANPQHLFFDAADEISSWDMRGCRIRVRGSAYGAAPKTVAMRRVSCRYGGFSTTDYWNAFGTDNWWGLVWFEECYGARAAVDCFNFHNTLATKPLFAVTLNCTGRDPGVFGAISSGSNNGWTSHENVIGLDVAGDYEYCQGRTLATIGTTKTVAHGSRFAKDRGDFYLPGGVGTNQPTEVATLDTAQIWLSECELSPDAPNAYAINAGGGTSIFLRNMPGVRGRVSGNVGTW
ncbi:hypothetical protein V5F32_00740 [Xanthobacter oligotrophicus]|uniref:Uncharacterized protein n=1 Tax=Xanthobacter oligotrophicus TaxID=2607286 RepID=A0ABW6ZSF1_9HYPH